ncbi:hypothetical protein WN943_023663 [Citrus x changshan-huyou]
MFGNAVRRLKTNLEKESSRQGGWPNKSIASIEGDCEIFLVRAKIDSEIQENVGSGSVPMQGFQARRALNNPVSSLLLKKAFRSFSSTVSDGLDLKITHRLKFEMLFVSLLVSFCKARLLVSLLVFLVGASKKILGTKMARDRKESSRQGGWPNKSIASIEGDCEIVINDT